MAMQVRAMRLRFLFFAATLAFLTAAMFSPLSRPAKAQFRVADRTNAPRQPEPDVTNPAVAQALLNSAQPVIGVFDLEADPVVIHERTLQPAQLRIKRVDVTSAEATQYETILATRQHTFEQQAAAIAPSLRIVAELRKLLNEVAIKAPGNQMAAIAALPGVKHFQLSRKMHATLDKSVPLINAPQLWNQLGGPSDGGKGIKIAILDTGIDITNPLFSGAGFTAPTGFPKGNTSFTNNKVISAKAFLEDLAATPEDQFGHGTNVAGIAAGDLNTPTPLGPISGVAPAAFLGNYRVLDATGQGDDALIGQGLEQAFADGFDVANLSLGGTPTDPPDAAYEAVENAVAGGMVVAVAAGNSGPGPMTVDSPGTAPHAITVGASTNSHNVGPSVSVNGPGSIPASLMNIASTLGATCAPESFPVGPFSVADESLEKQPLGCKAKKLSPGSLNGRIALIERGTCDFATKINNASNDGAVAAIVYNADLTVDPTDGGDTLITMDATGTTIPSVFVGRTDGLAIQSYVDSNPGATITISGAVQSDQTPDLLASFSSEGPTIDLVMKPDLCGPGVDIYSGALKSIGACEAQGVYDPSGFLAISGTSMATPHIAGSAALIKQLNPDWSPAQIKSALVNSTAATVLSGTGTEAAGILDAGAGRVDLVAASSVAATIAPSSLGFGLNKPKKNQSLAQSLQVAGVAAGETTFNVSVDPLTVASGVSVTVMPATITLSKGQTGTIHVTISAVSKNAQKGDQTGFVVLTSGSGATLRVPFWVRF